MKKLLVVALLSALVAVPTAFGRCRDNSCSKPAYTCNARKACVDTIVTKEIVNVPATQEVIRKVTTETSVGAIQCESCKCEDQHRPVSPDGCYAGQ